MDALFAAPEHAGGDLFVWGPSCETTSWHNVGGGLSDEQGASVSEGPCLPQMIGTLSFFHTLSVSLSERGLSSCVKVKGLVASFSPCMVIMVSQHARMVYS